MNSALHMYNAEVCNREEIHDAAYRTELVQYKYCFSVSLGVV